MMAVIKPPLKGGRGENCVLLLPAGYSQQGCSADTAAWGLCTGGASSDRPLLSSSLAVCYLLKSNISPDLCNEDGLTALHQVRHNRQNAPCFISSLSENREALPHCAGERAEIKPVSCCTQGFVPCW